MLIQKEQLVPGEIPIFRARQHPLVLFLPALLNFSALILLIGISIYSMRFWLLAFYVVPMIGFLLELLSWMKRSYVLTNTRIIKRDGILSVNTCYITLDTIQKVFSTQSIPGKLFRYGNIGIESSDRQQDTTFHFLLDPKEFMNRILHQQGLFKSGFKLT